ncbi:hypothetical protein EVC45_01515 [Paraburkholderia sp. UYCP14C]|uniref:hypothetical protein n=1 Tax=Paraburkholderia sp. UYCP14C TaxID=2511130 RepID=UPI00101FAF26|nr:hypothetical protein [Paraburkholderia sp. UYCP14C]RZF31767.1 hypothetical protein EVC45_01515 [Paraburkholderia sp. UYCP14C]
MKLLLLLLEKVEDGKRKPFKLESIARRTGGRILPRIRLEKRLGDAPKKPDGPEQGIGARSAAGRMTALSPGLNVREHRFQMHHYLTQTRVPA